MSSPPHFGLATLASLVALLALLAFPPAVAANDDAVPTLTEIRAAHHSGFDRIVFEFEGGMPQTTEARWVRRLRLDPSHRDAHVQGNAFIEVVLRYALGHQADPPHESTFGPTRRAFALPNIAHVVLLGDAEGQVTIGIGLMARTKIIRVTRLTSPDRFVVDVSSRYPKGTVQVFFADEVSMVEGGSDLVQAVPRKVPLGDRPHGAMQRLYAGPTAAEEAEGLRFVDSGSTGFRGPRISRSGVARVTLQGPCDSGGSALMTVADQIMATLHARPAVDFVKIYDRVGVTQEPRGRTDSIPFCLEP